MRKVLSGLAFLTLWAAMAQAGSSADEDAVRAVLQRQQQDELGEAFTTDHDGRTAFQTH